MTLRQKKSKPIPKNYEWGGVSKFWSTFGKVVEVGAVPPEFDVAAVKVKELDVLLQELLKSAKRYKKGCQAMTCAAQGFGENLSLIALECKKDNNLFVRAVTNMKETQFLTEGVNTEFSNKLDTKLVIPTENFLRDQLQYAREVKKIWKKSRIEYDDRKAKVEQIKLQASIEPIKMFIIQAQYHQARLKEKEKFEIAADAIESALWMRDYKILMYHTELMMVIHDLFADTYMYMYELDERNQNVLLQIEQQRMAYQEKVQKREEERRRMERETEESKYNGLVEMLGSNDFALLNAICSTAGSEQDEILASIVKILDAYNLALPIIKFYIREEVSQTKNATTLFRLNSQATKLMTTFTKLTGQSYLNSVLHDLIKEVIRDPNGYEVDPNKDEKQAAANMNKLMDICKRFIDVIINSLDECPMPFREITNYLVSEVSLRFPNAKTVAAGGFIFLRFFCPAILSPDTAGIVHQELNVKSRRSLVLISKSIQNLANGLKFGSKESYMNAMNSFIESNLVLVQNFLEKLAAVPQYTDYHGLCQVEEAVGTWLPMVHAHVVRNLEKIGQALCTNKQEEYLETLLVILGELGELDGVECRHTNTRKTMLDTLGEGIADFQKKLT